MRLPMPLFLVALVGLACQDQGSPVQPDDSSIAVSTRGGDPGPGSQGGPPSSAVMRFGNNSAGSPFDPGSGHDRSNHARDNLIPSTVVISAGGTVTFLVEPVHQVAIYAPGTEPEDIRLIPGVTLFPYVGPPGPPFIPNFLIDEPVNRIFLGPPISFVAGHQTSFTFHAPGLYLVICSVTPHFAVNKMYGWVRVK
jgi:plastocyanin